MIRDRSTTLAGEPLDTLRRLRAALEVRRDEFRALAPSDAASRKLLVRVELLLNLTNEMRRDLLN